MKRIFAVFALLAVLCTCGCSNQEDARPEQEDTNQQTTENRDENDIAGREDANDAEDNDTLGEDIRDGAEDMGDAVKQGVDDAGNAVKKGADKIEDTLDGDQTDGAETKPEK